MVIRQGKEQEFKPTLYIVPNKEKNKKWETALENGMKKIQEQYPGVSIEDSNDGLKVIIPQKYKTGHEQHFAVVLNKYLQYLQEEKMPKWEKYFMLTKYYTTMMALKVADNQ